MRFFWDQYPQEFQEEIKGIAAGVRERGGTVHGKLVDYKDIFTLNVIEETRETFNNPGGIGHPIKKLLKDLKMVLKSIFVKETSLKEYNSGHCNAFIATGDATVDGRIVASHSTIFPPNYIPQRANLILDLQPSKGNRFVMTTFPGYIWSSEDYHQNEQGIILMETSIWPPIGPWRVRDTTSVGARVRKAIQYSNSIEDVILTMLDGNNGLYPADWVMGDTKTEEIASLELGYFNYAVRKTKNGFFWSCNNPKNNKVKWEQYSIFRFGILGRILSKFYPKKTSRDKIFETLGNEYYGKIDIENVKKIMSTEGLSDSTTDCKITDTSLMKNLGLWAHMGRPDGKHWSPTAENIEKLRGLKEMPGTGWVRLFVSNSQPTDIPFDISIYEAKKDSKVIWTYQTENTLNRDYSLSTVSGDTIFTASGNSVIYALDKNKGMLQWKHEIGDKTVQLSTSKDFIFAGADSGLSAVYKNTGEVNWEKKIGSISSKPIITKNLVIVGCTNGELYAFDVDSGKQKWNYKLSDSVTVSEVRGSVIYIGSGYSCHAFNIDKEEKLWEFKTEGVITKTVVIDGKTIYFGSWDGNVYAVDNTNGNIKWKFKTGWGIDTTPAVSEDTVFVGSMDNKFYAIDKGNGKLKWCFTCLAGIHSSPIVYREFVFFGSDDGRLYALDKETGDLEWEFAPGYTINKDDADNFITTPILSDPIVKDGVVYINVKGNIYALDAQTSEQSERLQREPDDRNHMLIIFLLLALLGITLILRSILNK
jgi:outer membrane protein assembly factor BamB